LNLSKRKKRKEKKRRKKKEGKEKPIQKHSPPPSQCPSSP
jgi:hypothetical protein